MSWKGSHRWAWADVEGLGAVGRLQARQAGGAWDRGGLARVLWAEVASDDDTK